MDDLMNRINQAKAYIEKQIGDRQIYAGLILGSGLGAMAEDIADPVFIPYKDIPFFPVSTAPGHAGRLVIGELEGKTVMCLQGRFHYYEGYSMDIIAFPVQVMKLLGVQRLIVTNAAGCVNRAWEPGNLMLITDHIKLIPDCPLRGKNESALGLRFFDMSKAYDPELADIARAQAKNLGIPLKEGVYMFFAGPNFETPAEVRAAAILGADAVGMSTVPEVIAAAHCGIRTVGISCMTNMAAGILSQTLNEEEVIETGNRVRGQFSALIRSIIRTF